MICEKRIDFRKKMRKKSKMKFENCQKSAKIALKFLKIFLAKKKFKTSKIFLEKIRFLGKKFDFDGKKFDFDFSPFSTIFTI